LKSINNRKTLTAIVAISAIAVVLTASAQMAFAFFGRGTLPGTSITKTIDNPGTNLQTGTNQTQHCQSAGANSPLSGSCIANSNNQNTQSGGILDK
jgi:hypothetical protein